MLISPTAIIVIVLWLLGFAATMLVKRSPEALCGWMLAGWLFLPQFTLDLPGVVLTRVRLITLATGLAAFLVNADRRTMLRFSMVDLPVMGISLAAFGASLSNGLGVYDGFVVALDLFLLWGLPWFVGRFIFATPKNKKILIQYCIAAALVYVPFCLYEMKMAPILHSELYGYAPRGHSGLRGESLRFGLWRPMVFLETGLQLSLFMGISSVLAFWGALTHGVREILRIPVGKASAVLVIITVFCVSTGSIILTLLGWCFVFISRSKLKVYLLITICLIPILYPIYRMVNIGGLDVNISQDESMLSDREASLRFRIDSEDKFLQRWTQHPLLGWTSRYFRFSERKSIPDSLWIQMLCKFGLIGWMAVTAAMVLPVGNACRVLGRTTAHRRAEYILGLSVLIFMLDCLFNAMECPVYMIMAGAAAVVTIRDESTEITASTKPSHRVPRLRRVAWPTLQNPTT